MTNRKLKIGVIGLGHQSLEDHIPAIRASVDIELLCVSEIDQQKLSDFTNKNPDVRGYADFNELLKREKLDAVVVAVPHYLHYKVTEKALRQKLHVLKEKPFAVSLSEAQKLHELAKQQKVHIVITLQRRFNPIYSTFFQFIDKIGSPYYIEAKYTFYTNNPHEGWRSQRSLAGGGCLIDMGYHTIDLLMWYFGLPDTLFAEMSFAAKEDSAYDAEDTAQVIFRYKEKNIWGSLLVSRVIPPKQEYLHVFGTRGIIYLERGKIERYAPTGQLQESLKREHKWPAAAQDQIEYFARVVRGEQENTSGPEYHFNHLAFIEAAYVSKNQKSNSNPKELLSHG